MAFDIAKFIPRFVEEAREHIKILNQGLLTLEKNPGDSETMNAVVRSAHTIKGSSRMLKLTAITEVAHKLEDAMEALRAGRLKYSKGVFDLVFKSIGIISDMVEKTSEGQEITVDTSAICGKLEEACSRGDFQERDSAEPVVPTDTETEPVVPPETEAKPVAQAEPVVPTETEAKPVVPTDTEAEPVVPPETEAEPEAQAEPVAQAEPEAPEEAGQAVETTASAPKAKTIETIRVSAERLDTLIKLVGEMISSQNRLKQSLSGIKRVERLSEENAELTTVLEDGGSSSNGHAALIIDRARSLHNELKELAPLIRDDINLQDVLVGELQERALRMRMLPLSTVFDTFHMAVRDISGSLGKEIDLTIKGEETELDKKIVEKIGDPLMHMIRNSIDHGIEKPEDRLKAGKPPRGQIKLSARYEGGNVLIELSDDGSGINLEKIKEKALRKGLVDENTLKTMQESEITDLIFHHGLSTSPIITDISGRGVGMDVVKENIINELKGSVQIKTKETEGTSFYIRLPLTLAIMRGLLFTVSGMTFAIPANSVDEILRIPVTEIIDVVDKKAIRLREQIIPVERASALLNLQGNEQDEGDSLIVIARVGTEKMGIVIDSLLDESDMVIKPLPAHMRNVPLVSGVAISGKNEVINILHVPELLKAAKEVKAVGRLRGGEVERQRMSLSILVVDDSTNTREIEKAILESYGYTVALAGDGIEALEKIRDFKYDLVITDIEMPNMDGFTLTEKLRADEGYKDTPIVIVTSREKDEDKRRGIEVGADAYIIKGTFDQSNLLSTIENLLG